jgi:hypothetical protein
MIIPGLKTCHSCVSACLAATVILSPRRKRALFGAFKAVSARFESSDARVVAGPVPATSIVEYTAG